MRFDVNACLSPWEEVQEALFIEWGPNLASIASIMVQIALFA